MIPETEGSWTERRCPHQSDRGGRHLDRRPSLGVRLLGDRRTFTRGPWSQTEGIAVVLALDRIVGPVWKRHAFGDGEPTVLGILDAALAEG